MEKSKQAEINIEGAITLFRRMVPPKDVNPEDDYPIDITLHDFIEGVRSGHEWKRITEAIRHEKDAERQKYLKNAAPCVRVRGRFATRKDNSILSNSSFFDVDIDGLGQDTDDIKEKLQRDPYTYAIFKTVRGEGLCVIVRIMPQRWEDTWDGIKRYYLKTYGIVVDKSTGNVGRNRVISHDPAIFTNYDARLFKEFVPAKEKKAAQKPLGAFVHTGRDIDNLIEQIRDKAIDFTQDYDDWVKVGWSLQSEYGEGARDYFHQVSQFHPEYDPVACDRKFDYLLRENPKKLTIAYFYARCKAAGLEWMTSETRRLVRLAEMRKKGHVKEASAVDEIVKMEGVDRKEAESIVGQVYKAIESFDTGDTLFDQLELFLKTNYPMRRNEISRYIEDEDGRSVLEEDLNGIWIHAVKLVSDKVTDKMVSKLIYSSFTPTYNPLKEFFEKHKHRRPKGTIEALVNTIKTNTGFHESAFFPNYAELVIRKWILGIVASVFDKYSSLVLILTGPKGTGKTEWFRRLLPAELSQYFAETTWPPGKDTEMLMCENLIAFNDEWKGKTVKDPETIKGLASADRFTLREPYGRMNVKRRRLAVMGGTSNPTAIIADPDNNRKIIPVHVESVVNFAAYNAIDKIDVLMEAYHAYMEGESHELSQEEIKRISDNITGFESHSIERLLLEQFVTMPTGNGGEDVQFLSSLQIQLYLETKANNRKLSETMIGRELNSMGFNKRQKRNGEGKRPWGYDVVLW